jgi:hypothetical protein
MSKRVFNSESKAIEFANAVGGQIKRNRYGSFSKGKFTVKYNREKKNRRKRIRGGRPTRDDQNDS